MAKKLQTSSEWKLCMAITRKISPGNRAVYILHHRAGTVKKTALSDFANVRRGGIIAIKIVPGDTLIEPDSQPVTTMSYWSQQKG